MLNHMLTAIILLACCFISVGCSRTSPPGQSQSARAVAEDFFIITGTHFSDNGMSWNGPETSKAEPFTTPSFRAQWKTTQWKNFKSFSITSETMDPSQKKATIRGSLQVYQGKELGKEHVFDAVGFRMTLLKSEEKWLVNDIEFGAAPVESKP
jgi:hypothetical protein